MKRFNIDAPAKDQYEEADDGEWVRYDDVEANDRALAAVERIGRHNDQARVRELAAENERLRSGLTVEALRTIRSDELTRVRGLLVAAEARVRDLEAENERLRAAARQADTERAFWKTQAEAAESRLATAAGLARDIKGFGFQFTRGVQDRINALANQPAAPAVGFTADELRRLEKPPARLRVVAATEARLRELEEENLNNSRCLEQSIQREEKTASRLAAASALMGRIIKYSLEDGAVTPGFTRLLRVLGEAETFLANQPAAPTRTYPNDLALADADELREEVLRLRASAPTRTEAEQAVLDACAAMSLNDDDPDADASEPQEHGEDCYIYTDDQQRIARAELARRVLK